MKREIFVGPVGIGGKHPVSIQSMTKTQTSNVDETLKQIREIMKAGGDIVRVGIPDRSYLSAFKRIVEGSILPVIADIHFDVTLALKSIEYGAHCVRINPGNIGSKRGIKDIINLAKQKRIPIRIGVNAGSLEKKYLHTQLTRVERMVSSMMDLIKFFEDNDFFNLKLSLKSSDVKETVAAYRVIDIKCDYPLHVGITESGPFFRGSVKSAIGIGALLLDGIGNTIRVSLTDEPLREVQVAAEILRTLGLRRRGIELISCPTCSRTTIDLITEVKAFEKRILDNRFQKPVKVAVMGCEVNGPGEAKDADIGVAFSKDKGIIFQKGKILEKVSARHAISRLLEILGEMG